MNWNRIEDGWKQSMDKAKKQWCKLVGDLLACKTHEPNGISRRQMAVWQEHQERKDHPR